MVAVISFNPRKLWLAFQGFSEAIGLIYGEFFFECEVDENSQSKSNFGQILAFRNLLAAHSFLNDFTAKSGCRNNTLKIMVLAFADMIFSSLIKAIRSQSVAHPYRSETAKS